MPVTKSSRFPTIAKEMGPRVQAALEIVAEAVVIDASFRAPYDTGRGRRFDEAGDRIHIRDRIHKRKTDDGYIVYGGDEKAWYGHFLEFGTVKMAAQPFLGPAAEGRREFLENQVNRVLNNL